jgi:flagellar M-ring protein FliF
MPDAVDRVLEQLGGGRRLLPALVVVVAVGVMWGFARWAMAPTYVPLLPNLPIESVGEITSKLDEEKIDYRLDGGGTTVSVQEAHVVRARVALAQSGFPSPGRPGFELFDQQAWGMTDFTQKVNYRRALEGELRRTISQMRGVQDAHVHLAIQRSSFLRRDEPRAEASVVLSLRAGTRPDDVMVEGIAFLVAGSVEGLARENVTVLDDTGRLLSSPDDNLSPTGLTNRQLLVRRDVEGYLEEKAYELVEQIVGPGNATIRVAANLNFDQIGRTVEELNLDQQATLSEDRSEIIPGTEDQGASSVTVNTRFQTPRTIETLSRAGARVERLTVAVLVNHRPVGDGPDLRYEERTQQELVQVEALVRNAVGIEMERGDAITVASVPFDRRPISVPEVQEGMDLLGILQVAGRPSVGILGLILAFALAMKLLAALRAGAPASRHRSLPAGSKAHAVEEGPHSGSMAEGAAPLHFQAPPKVQLSDPSMTARVVRAWMNES